MIKKILAAALAASLSLAGAYTAAAQDTGKVGVVVKIGGIPWFNAMEAGIKERGEKLGVDAFMVGPTSADPALQVRAIEDLIAQNVKVIGVVPNDAKVLEPVLTKAREKGIIVITHESAARRARIGISSSRRPPASVRRMQSCLRRRWAARANMPSSWAR